MSDPRDVECGEPEGGIVDQLVAENERLKAELEVANWKLLRMIDRCNEAIETDEVAQGTSRQNWLTWLVFEWKAQQEAGE